MENTAPQSKPLSPWFSIWVSPRKTIRQILETDPQQYVILLAALSGTFQAIDNAAERALGDGLDLFPLLALSAAFGSITGIISLYVGGALFRWTGSLLGGQAPSEYVRTALAWSSIPDVLLLLVFIPIIVAFGRNWFTSSIEWLARTPMAGGIVVLLAFVGLAMLIWRMVLFVICLSEVHSISVWRSLAASVAGVLIVAVVALIVF